MTHEARAAAAAVIFLLGWIAIFFYRSEHVGPKLAVATPAERRWIPLTIVVVSVHTTLAEAFLTMPIVLGKSAVAFSSLRLGAGVALFGGGLAWWAWARRSLGPLGRPLDTTRPPAELIVTGPFAVVRHPLALGTLLIALGPAVVVGALATWVTFVAVALCLARRCGQDEDELRAVFGEAYARYAARTRRLVPFVW